jgi:hypothetical protein
MNLLKKEDQKNIPLRKKQKQEGDIVEDAYKQINHSSFQHNFKVLLSHFKNTALERNL